jgi:hypothetical protein
MTNSPKCGCGRSPTGNCMGWHALTEEEYEKKKTAYEAAIQKRKMRCQIDPTICVKNRRRAYENH